MTGKWRRLHIEELYDLCSSPFIIVVESRRVRCAVHVACMVERVGSDWVLVGELGGKRPLGSPMCRWEDNNNNNSNNKMGVY
jgi:hypothetical protein